MLTFGISGVSGFQWFLVEVSFVMCAEPGGRRTPDRLSVLNRRSLVPASQGVAVKRSVLSSY